MQFSVLMSVYHKENASHFDAALLSIENQTLTPDQVVIVKDGPLSFELEQVIGVHTKSSSINYTVVALKKNVGLGIALNEGIKYCKYKWVARMDTDDIALPDRFEKQFSYLDEHPETDLLGGWICEFDNKPEQCTKKRRVPASHEAIVRFAKYRNPVNHMTVVCKKEAMQSAGGYLPMNGFEDYYLWMRMLLNGCRFANLPEVLVKARTGRGMIRRRQGWKYAWDEWELEKAAYAIGFWSTKDLVRNLFVRLLPRLLPVFVVEKLYNLLRNI